MRPAYRGRCFLIGVSLSLHACGGSARSGDSSPPPAEGGAGGAFEADAGAGEAGIPGTGTGTGGTGTGGALGAAGFPSAGAAGRADEPPLDDDSGTTICLEDRDCPNDLPCTSAVGPAQRACLAPCPTDDACFETQRCVSSPFVPASCFSLCQWPWDCAYQFDCVLPRARAEYVCVPAQWAERVTGPEPL